MAQTNLCCESLWTHCLPREATTRNSYLDGPNLETVAPQFTFLVLSLKDIKLEWKKYLALVQRDNKGNNWLQKAE